MDWMNSLFLTFLAEGDITVCHIFYRLHSGMTCQPMLSNVLLFAGTLYTSDMTCVSVWECDTLGINDLLAHDACAGAHRASYSSC
jgi:hypothetical protein